VITNNSPHVRFAAYDWKTHISGPGTWLGELLPALQVRGLRCSVDLLFWDEPGPLQEVLCNADIPMTSTRIQGTAIDRIRGILERASAKPVDVFVPNLCVPAFHAARWFRKVGIPTVGILHSDDDFYAGLLDVFAKGRKTDAVSHFVVVSQALEEKANAARRFDTAISRIPYGVSDRLTASRKTDRSGLSVVYVGRVAEQQKRIVDVTRALIRIVSEVPQCTAKIIGDGPDMQVVKSILQQSNLAGSIELTGRLDSAGVWDSMVTADVILLLSDYEGLPIALLEGMCCGLVPVVSRMHSGIPELIRHSVNGLIVEDRSDTVVAAIQRLNQDRTLLRQLSTAARETILRHYSHTACADAWASLIRALAANRRGNHRSLRVPRSFDLPPVHNALAGEDPRPAAVSGWNSLINTGRFIARSLFQEKKSPPR
jgi:colanic acid/amylovoran biosynthesis glycosyltransferase